tara:strand:+ start:3606 stop:4517 length:912 start_codon:yes stop_codon:yes gene_type:complete
MNKPRQRKDLSATRQLLEGFKKRKARKLEERTQKIADQIGDNPTLTVSGDAKSIPHDQYGNISGREARNKYGDYLEGSTETKRQRLIYDDENPTLTKQDRLNIEKEINHTEYDQRLDTEDVYAGIRTTLNKDFQAAANERLKQKHKEALIRLNREKPAYNRAEDRSVNVFSPESGNRKYDPFVDDFDPNGEFSTRLPGQDPDDPYPDPVLPTRDEDSPFRQHADRADIKRTAATLQKVKNPPVMQEDAKYSKAKPATELPTFTVGYSKADAEMGLKSRSGQAGITTHRPSPEMIKEKIESQKS